MTKFNKLFLRWQTFQMVWIHQSNRNSHDTNTVSTQNVAYLNCLMWPLAQDFIELPNNNRQQNKNDDNESMDNLYWYKRRLKSRTVKITGQLSLPSFHNSYMTPLASPHTIKFNSDYSLIDHSNSLTHFKPTSSFSRASYWSQIFNF
jgi:hypothetical protein